jgi:hypothetical protein
MTGADLQVEVRNQDIIVTMPETSFRVVYRKPNRGSQLVARLDYFKRIRRAQSRGHSSSLGPRSSPTTRRGSWGGLSDATLCPDYESFEETILSCSTC